MATCRTYLAVVLASKLRQEIRGETEAIEAK